MSPVIRKLVRYLPLMVGLAILAVAAPLVQWDKVWPYLARLSPLTILLLVASSGLYYLGRILRYWLMLRMLEQPVSFGRVALACLVAQPVSVLPGGELYRSAMLKRYGNVAPATSLPSVFAQSLAESVGLVAIALVGALAIHRYLNIVCVIAIVFGCLWLFIRSRHAHHGRTIVNIVPGVNIHHHRWRSFVEKNRVLLEGGNFGLIVLASYVSAAGGIGVLYIAAHRLGAPLSLEQAAIAYALPTVLEAVSFLPAGLGINEQGSVGILTLFGTGLPLAVALTILVRLFTLGVGFLYGFVAMGWAKFAGSKTYR